MAAGRHGGYRDNEFRDHESDFDVSRREFSFPNSDYDRIRNGDRNHGRGRVPNQGKGDRVRVRGKDIKERELSNGGYRSASSRSDSGSRGSGANRSQFSVGAMDREPGELSSESGSDEAIDSESQVIVNDGSKLENTGSLPVESKKRKFSPIVWDRDDKEVGNTSRSSSVATSLPPPPPLPKSYRQSPTLIPDGGVLISPVEDSNVQTLEPSPAKPPVVTVLGLHVSDVSLSTVDLSSSPEEQRYANNYQEREAEQADDEDYIPTRKISASRWAADANSPVDEGEISDAEEMPKRRKKTPLSELMEMKIRSKSLTPEPGELDREGSEGARARSSESDGGYHDRSSSGDDYRMDNSYKNDFMEIDEEHDNNCIRVSRSHAESEDEHDSHGTPEPVITSKRAVNMLKACRSVDVFEKLNKIDEGTYGVVYRAKDMDSGDIVALKKVKMEKEREGFPLTSLREINILLSFHHPSIVDVKEVVVGSALDSIFMVMEYMDHDLKVFMETMKHPFSQSEVKCLMLQLLGGVKYLHDNWVLHRDLKTSNLLLNNQGELKICDFGLARQYGSPLKPYTHLVVTLWYSVFGFAKWGCVYSFDIPQPFTPFAVAYCLLELMVSSYELGSTRLLVLRAPELLLGAKQYSTAIDMWSLGCIMAELLSKAPLFNGKTEFDQLDKIFRILGTPNETIWPGFSKLPGVKVNFVKHQLPALGDSGLAFWPPLVTVSVLVWYNLLRRKFPATSFTGSPVLSDAGFDLLNKLLTYDPEKRITAEDALNHEWFREVPLPKSKEFMPTFPAQHEEDRRLRSRRVMKSPDPLEEQRRKELQQGELVLLGGGVLTIDEEFDQNSSTWKVYCLVWFGFLQHTSHAITWNYGGVNEAVCFCLMCLFYDIFWECHCSIRASRLRRLLTQSGIYRNSNYVFRSSEIRFVSFRLNKNVEKFFCVEESRRHSSQINLQILGSDSWEINPSRSDMDTGQKSCMARALELKLFKVANGKRRQSDSKMLKKDFCLL
ncbi:hypothetical protein RHGRI_034205 [Rhododendron griersonianum]|uniref:cyclin-dependent kinase n=1 Tax=Rhododendron griersonianum TaxID=479676 RepID=A0AAV6I3I5_9ERIC|nr:hypothetical protein RHGRI_034205 [Rhododendron griersonianum]